MSKSLPPYGYLPYGYSPSLCIIPALWDIKLLLRHHMSKSLPPYGYLPYGYLPSLCIIPARWDIFQFKYQKQTPVIKTLTMVAMMHVLRLNPANRLS